MEHELLSPTSRANGCGHIEGYAVWDLRGAFIITQPSIQMNDMTYPHHTFCEGIDAGEHVLPFDSMWNIHCLAKHLNSTNVDILKGMDFGLPMELYNEYTSK